VQQSLIAEGSPVLHDGLTKVPACLNACRCKSVTRVQTSHVRTVSTPAAQIDSCPARLERSGNVGWAAWMNLAPYECGVEVRALNVGPCPLAAGCSNINGRMTASNMHI
jgi:hypothetical protein